MAIQHTSTSSTDREYLTKMLAPAPLSAPAERLLLERARMGSASAKETIVLHNMRLVKSIATSYEGRNQLGPRTAGGLELTDLMDEGAIALTNAVDRFDPSRGADFRSYAEQAIRNQINKALNNLEDLVRMPEKAARLERTIFRIEDERRMQGITTPLTDEQLAEALGETVSMVHHVRTAPRVVTSLQTPTESGTELGALLADTHADPSLEIEESALDHITPEQLPELLNSIKPKYSEPIRRHMLEGKTLEETSRELGQSATTTAKNIRRGLGQLRHAATKQAQRQETSAQLQAGAMRKGAQL